MKKIEIINLGKAEGHLKKQLSNMQAYDIASIVEHYDAKDRKKILSLLELNKLTNVLIELSYGTNLEYLDSLELEDKKKLINAYESDDLKDLIANIDKSRQDELFLLMDAKKAAKIRRLMTYEDNLAASIMSTDFITIPISESVKNATSYIFKNVRDQDYIDALYITNENNILKGVLDVKKLIIARADDKIESIMNEDFHYVLSDTSIDDAIDIVKNYDRNAIPVLDDNMHILGIITADDVIDELFDSSDESFHKMVSVTDFDEDHGALRRSIKRLPWLLASVVLNLVIANLLLIFETTIEQVTALVLFQPMILGMAGNIGTQSIAVTILGIHKNEFKDKLKYKKNIIREVLISFINSVIVGVIAFFIVFLYLTVIPAKSGHSPASIGAVVMLSLFGGMFISGIIGVFIPLGLNKLKIDPAIASGPIISTINDLVALMIYFGIATLLLLS